MLNQTSILNRCWQTMQNKIAAFGRVAIIVHPNSELKDWDKDQIQQLFLYPQNHPGFIVGDLPSGESKHYFYENFIGKSPIQMQAHWQKSQAPSQEFDDDDAAIEWVSNNENAIAYIEASAIDKRVDALIL